MIPAGGYYVATPTTARAASASAPATRPGCSRPAAPAGRQLRLDLARAPRPTAAAPTAPARSPDHELHAGRGERLPRPPRARGPAARRRARRRRRRVRPEPQRPRLPAVRHERAGRAVGGAQQPVDALPADLGRHEVDARHGQRLGQRQGAALSRRHGRAGRRGRDARRRRRRTAIFVSTERNDDGPNSNISRPAVLRFDVSAAGTTLTATDDWNLTADLPGAAARTPASRPSPGSRTSVLVAKGFIDDGTGTTYNPADYPDHGNGLFFVGVEQDGRIFAYALNQTTGTLRRGRDDRQRLPGVMELNSSPRPAASGRSATTAATAGPRRWTSPSRARTRQLRRHRHLRAPGRHAEPQQRGLRHRPAGRVRRRLQAGLLHRRQQHRRPRAAHRHDQLHGGRPGPRAHGDADADADPDEPAAEQPGALPQPQQKSRPPRSSSTPTTPPRG